MTQPRSTFEQNEYELRHSRNDPFINKSRRNYPVQFVVEKNEQNTETLDRPIIPAGIHLLTIVAAEEGPNEWKRTDDNPQGMCLKLRLSSQSGGFKFIFDDIPMHLGWRAKQLAEAVGIIAAGENLSLTPEELVDQFVTVEVSHYTSKAGKTSAVVKKYLPPDQSRLPKSQAEKLKAKALPKPPAMPEDDIPF